MGSLSVLLVSSASCRNKSSFASGSVWPMPAFCPVKARNVVWSSERLGRVVVKVNSVVGSEAAARVWNDVLLAAAGGGGRGERERASGLEKFVEDLFTAFRGAEDSKRRWDRARKGGLALEEEREKLKSKASGDEAGSPFGAPSSLL